MHMCTVSSRQLPDAHFFKSHADARLRVFQPHTDDTIRNCLINLRTSKAILGVGAFDEKEKALGFNLTPYNMLLDPELQGRVSVPRHNVFDWPHCAVINGVANHHMGLAMQALSPGLRYADLHRCGIFPNQSLPLYRGPIADSVRD